MDELDLNQNLAEMYRSNIDRNIVLDIHKFTLFKDEQLKNVMNTIDYSYPENFEENRARKNRLAKIIFNQLKLYPINAENLKFADEIRVALINNTLFENISNFSNLEIDEEKLKKVMEAYSKSTRSLKDICHQCHKDMFVLRTIWFANELNKLITNIPFSTDEKACNEMIKQKNSMRNYIDDKTKEIIETVVNELTANSMYQIETALLNIGQEKMMLTQFSSKQLDSLKYELSRNGFDKEANSCANNLESAKATLTNYFNVLNACCKKALELQGNQTLSQQEMSK